MAGRKPAWKRNAVTNSVGEDGLRQVNLPSLKSVGISDADRDAIFAFERPILGTMRATMRIGHRAQGGKRLDKATGNFVPMTLIPKRLAEAGPIPENLREFYK